MKTLFIDAKYKGKVELTSKVLNFLKKYKKIGLYTITQFNHKLPFVIKQLKEIGIEVISSKPERTNAKFQILGCDVYNGNMKLEKNVDAFLYIGDGKFHPLALIYSMVDSGNDKEVIVFNPIDNSMKIFDKKNVEKVLMKKKANIKKFLMSKKIGVLITSKIGQEHFHYIEKLEKKFKDKEFYAFISDNVDFGEMENFPFVQVWVNTACPRLALEDALNTEKSLVNVEDVLRL